MNETHPNRNCIRADDWETFRHITTDQRKGVPHPPLQKPYPEDAELTDLVAPEELTAGGLSLREAIARRESVRRYSDAPLTLEELSFLLWATQGVRKVLPNGVALFRTVPSAGARHPFETYLVVNRVEGLEPGLYRYLSLEHKLLFLYAEPHLAMRAATACNNQIFVAKSAITFAWTVIPYRTEWRYSVISPKIIALDAGHVCQNLYLACEGVDAGTCAIAAYDQDAMDELLRVDGEEEFTIYVAPVGKV